MQGKPYPSDVADVEWTFVVPDLAVVCEDALQRVHDLREIYTAVRWLVRMRAPWPYLPSDLLPWTAVYQRTQRWLAAGVFEAMVHDLRSLVRLPEGRPPAPTATVLDGRTLQSTVESGARAGYDG